MTPQQRKALFDMDGTLTRLEGAASAMAGAGACEVALVVRHGMAWLSGDISGLVSEVRELWEAASKDDGGDKPGGAS